MEYGNLAYKDYQYHPARKKPQQNKADKRKHNQMLNRRKNIRRICAIIMVSLAASFMISEFVSVNETKQQVALLEKELTAEESITSQKMFELEQSVDLSEIEEEATTRLGMQRPERYQMIYVNVKQNDVTEKTAGEVESLPSRIASSLKKLGSNIVSFFSIE